MAEPSEPDKFRAPADFIEKPPTVFKEVPEQSDTTVKAESDGMSAPVGKPLYEPPADPFAGLFDFYLIVYVFAFASIISIFSGISFIADLFCQFRVQMAAGQLLIALVLAYLCKTRAGTKGPKIKLLVLTLLTMVLNIVSVAFTTLPIAGVNQSEGSIVRTFNNVSPLPGEKFAQAGKNLTLVQFNLRNKNEKYGKFKEYVRKLHPQIICLQEYTRGWEAALAELKKDYPYQISQTREDPFGIAIFSRYPMLHSEILALGRAGLPSAYCQVEIGGRTVGILSTHPFPPLNATAYASRNGQYRDIADFIARNDSASFVLAGDLNCAPWSACFGDLLSRAHLRDSRIGFGIGQSWPSDWWILRIPIDHVLTSRNIDTVRRDVGENLGSDHLPVYVELLAR